MYVYVNRHYLDMNLRKVLYDFIRTEIGQESMGRLYDFICAMASDDFNIYI